MTMPSTPLREDHTLTGAIVPLPYNWRVDNKADLLVTLVNTSVTPNIETPLTVDTDYTVSNVGNESGGNVTPTTAYTAGWRIVITNDVDYEQDTDFTNQNSVLPEVVELMADNLSKQIKQIVEALTRCVKVTVGSLSDPNDLIDTLLSYVTQANTSATTATTQAGIATTQAGIAAGWATTAQNAATGINWTKARAASTANVNIASAPASIDGVTLANGDRILLKNQSAPAENGIRIFTATGAALARSTDMDTWAEVVSKVVQIEEGTVNADIPYISNVNTGGTINVTAITFAVFSPPIQDGAINTAAKIVDDIITYAKLSAAAFATTVDDIVNGTANKLIDAATLKLFRTTPPILRVQCTKANGINGGQRAAAGSWQDSNAAAEVMLNTVVTNNITGASVVSGVITLPAGTYKVRGWKSFLNTAGSRVRFYNITDATALIVGSSAYAGGSAGLDKSTFDDHFFTIAATKTIKMQTWVNGTSGSTADFGSAPTTGDTEVYGDFTFEKVA